MVEVVELDVVVYREGVWVFWEEREGDREEDDEGIFCKLFEDSIN